MYNFKMNNKKYTKKQVFKAYTSLKKLKEIAKELNIPESHIRKIRRKEVWAWYTNEIDNMLASNNLKIYSNGNKRKFIIII